MTTAGDRITGALLDRKKYWASEMVTIAGAILLGEELEEYQMRQLRRGVDHLAPDPNALAEGETLGPLFRHWSELSPTIKAAGLDGDHLRPGKTTLLFGQPGTFKSWWAMFRAMRIAASGKTVAWFDTEEGEAGFAERLHAIQEGWAHIGAGYNIDDGRLYYASMERLIKDEERFPAEISTMNPDLVVIDVGIMASGSSVDESLVLAFWNALRVACPLQAAVLVISHPPKNEGQTAMGSQLWTSRSREIYEAKDDRFGPSSIVTISDVKLKIVPTHSYRYMFDHGAVEIEELGFMSDDAIKKMGYKELIYQTLRKGSITRAELWEAVQEQDEDRKKSTFESVVTRAAKRGYIITLPDGSLGLQNHE